MGRPVGVAHHVAYGVVVLVSLAAQLLFCVLALFGVMLTDSCSATSTEAVCGPGLLALVIGPWILGALSVVAVIIGWVSLARRRRRAAWSLLLGCTVVYFVYWFGTAAWLTA